MKLLFVAALALAASAAQAQSQVKTQSRTRPDYPSCDLAAQHALKGEIGGSVKDAAQAHIAMRVNILQADLGSARKAERLSRTQADRQFRRADAVKAAVDRFVRKQGFLSAAEAATYDRQLDAISAPICRR